MAESKNVRIIDVDASKGRAFGEIADDDTVIVLRNNPDILSFKDEVSGLVDLLAEGRPLTSEAYYVECKVAGEEQIISSSESGGNEQVRRFLDRLTHLIIGLDVTIVEYALVYSGGVEENEVLLKWHVDMGDNELGLETCQVVVYLDGVDTIFEASGTIEARDEATQMEDDFTPSAEIQKILLSTGDAVMFNSSRRAIVHRAIAAAAGARTGAVIDFNSLLPGTLDLGVPEDLYLGYD